MEAPIWREWYVMGCLTLNHLGTGFILGFPAILTPAITDINFNDTYSDVHTTENEASWITAAFGMTGPIGFLILPGLMQIYGRRFINILINLIIFSGFIIIATSSDVSSLIAGRSVQGIAFGGLYITSILAAEYSDPKRRGFFIVFKMTASSLGALICHSLGFTLNWRQMAWLATIPPVLAVIGTFKWPESPSWLAFMGKYGESEAAFEWLHGSSMTARKEIRKLISVQKTLKALEDSRTCPEKLSLMRSREFLKPFFILIVLVVMLQVCGRHYLLAYVVEIMVQLTGDKSQAFYYTIVFDVMKTLAILVSSLMVRVINRRTLLFTSGVLSSILLSLVCVFHYLNSLKIFKFRWLTPVLLILYSFVCNVGIIPLAIVFKGEIFPLKYRGIGTCAIGIIYSLLGMVTLKMTSSMLVALEAHGTFAVYLCTAIITFIVLYFILPETKDRTMQDIEMNFIDLKFENNEDLSEKDERKLITLA